MEQETIGMKKIDLSNEEQNAALIIVAEEVARTFGVPPHLLIGESPIIAHFSTKKNAG
jgi:hypothetical protein